MGCCTHDYVMFYKAPFASRLAALEEASCSEAHGCWGGPHARLYGQPPGAESGLQQEAEALCLVATRKYILPTAWGGEGAGLSLVEFLMRPHPHWHLSHSLVRPRCRGSAKLCSDLQELWDIKCCCFISFLIFLMCRYIYMLPKKINTVPAFSFWKKVKVLVTHSCQTVVTPWTVAHQAPLSMGFSRQEYWSGLPFPSPGDLPDPGIEPVSPTLQVDYLLSEPQREECGEKFVFNKRSQYVESKERGFESLFYSDCFGFLPLGESFINSFVFWGRLLKGKFFLTFKENPLLNLLQYFVLCFFGFFGHEVCGMSAPWSGMEPAPPAMEGKLLTTGSPRES